MKNKRRNFNQTITEKRFWFEWYAAPNSKSYNSNFLFILKGELQVNKLKKAIKIVTDTEEYLRSIFIVNNKGEYRRVLKNYTPLFNISQMSDVFTQDKITRLFFKESFDITKKPPWNYLLTKKGNNQYTLCFKFHHVMADAFYVQSIFKKICDTYSQLITKGHCNNVNLSNLIQPSAYSVDKSSKGYWHSVDYWNQKLQNYESKILNPIELISNGNKGNRYQTKFNKEFSKEILKFGSSKNITPFILISAVFCIIFKKYLSQNNIIVGYAKTMRDKLSYDYPGCNVNILPLISDIKNNHTFMDIIEHLSNQFKKDQNHYLIPTSELIKSASSSISEKKWFNIQINHTTSTSFDFKLPKIDSKMKFLRHIEMQPNTDLVIRFDVISQRILIEIEIKKTNYTKLVSRAILNSINTIFEQVIVDCNKKINDIEVVSGMDYKELFKSSKKNYYNTDTAINKLFENTAARLPKNIAVTFKDTKLTYEELNSVSNQCAQFIIAQGAVQGDIIGISYNRSIELLVLILGIIKAGCAYLPIDPEIPKQRLEYIIEHSKLKFSVIEKSLKNKFKAIRNDFIVPNFDEFDLFSKENQDNLRCNLKAYVIYTSGTTGNPKGVVISHVALVNRIVWMKNEYKINASDIVLQKTPFYFDVSVWEFFLPLISGATLIMLEPGFHRDPKAILESIHKNSVTICHFIPSMLNIFLDYIECEKISSIRYIMVSGEALSYTTVVKFYNKFSNAILANLYGPTEATIDVTYWNTKINKEQKVYIGKAITNMRAYVLSSDKSILPFGVSGELYVAGISVASCYLNNPKLTQAKFQKDIINRKEIMYKTGDLARTYPDGNIEFIGRVDRQIKIRGHRIEIPEIEEILSRCRFIKENAVVYLTAPVESLVAAVVLDSEEIRPNELLKLIYEELKEIIPDYMIPNKIFFTRHLPRTSNGKFDYKEIENILRNMVLEERNDNQNKIKNMPGDNITRSIAKIWSKLLNRKISSSDNFFSMGGNSLLAMRAVLLCQSQKINIELYDLYEAKDLESLSNIIKHKNTKDLSVLSKSYDNNKIPLSFYQKEVWSDYRRNPSSFNVPLVFKLDGKLNIEALKHAVKVLFKKHDALRTNFFSTKSEYVYQYVSNKNFKLNVIDISISTDSEIDKYINELINKQYDYMDNPAIRFLLLSKSNIDNTLVLIINHILFDSWSLDILYREINAEYTSFCKNNFKTATKKPNQYSDFIFSQKSKLKNMVKKLDIEYFKHNFYPINKIQLPKIKNAVEDKNALNTYIFNFSDNSIRKFVADKASTVTPLALSLLFCLLYNLTREKTISLGFLFTVRPSADEKDTIGYFTTIYTINVDFNQNITFDDVFTTVQEKLNHLRSIQNMPYHYVLQTLKLRKITNNIVYISQNINDQVFNFNGVKLSYKEYNQNIQTQDLLFELFEKKDTLRLSLKLKRDLATDKFKTLVDKIEKFLLEAVSNPQINVLSWISQYPNC